LRAALFPLEQGIGSGHQLGIRMRGTIAAKLSGVGCQLIDVDDRRVFVGAIVTIEPGENERDLVLGRGLELPAGWSP